MALSRSEIQKKSDAKRGVKSKGFKLKIEDIDYLQKLSQQSGRSQTDIITEGMRLWAEKHGINL